MKILLLAIATLTLASCATAPVASTAWRNDCGAIDEVKYCYHEVGTPDPSKQVIVFNHGLYDAETTFITPPAVKSDYPALIAKFPQGTRIVSLSWGQAYMLTDYPNRKLAPVTATPDRYLEVLAKLEQKYSFHGPYRLVGHSMGGSNTAELCAKLKDAYFSKCALMNPMVVKDSFRVSWDKPLPVLAVVDGILKTLTGDGPSLLIRVNYENNDQWLQYRPEPVAGMPPLWVHACTADNFGLYPGAEEYVVKARKLGNGVRFVTTKCGLLNSHWTFDPDDLIAFLEGP